MNNHLRLASYLLIALFFGLILAVIIPAYVEIPVFIPGFAPGPKAWPTTIAITGLAVSGLATLHVIFTEYKSRTLQKADRQKQAAPDQLALYSGRFALSLVILYGYVYLIPVVGIVIASSLLLAVLFVFIGIKSHVKWMIVLSILTPIIIYLIFNKVTHTMFPAGWLWDKFGLL